MEFVPIDVNLHKNYVTAFRRDSFIISFGTDKDFEEEEYLNWLKQQSSKNPKGIVLVLENEEPIGQLELTLKKYNGYEIGYVNLYYLISRKKRNGYRFLSTQLCNSIFQKQET